MCVFQEHVLLDLFDGDLRARRAAFLRLLDGEGVVDSVHLLVVTVIHLGLFAPAKRRNLPAGFAVIGLDRYESLDDGLLPDLVRALVLLAEFRAKRALADLCRGPDAAHGFQLFQSSMRLNIFGDHFVYSLCAGNERKERDGHEYRKEESKNPGELPDWSQW